MTAGTRLRFSAADVARLIGGNPPTAEQTAIIEAPLGPNVVIAGAGSGKTETIATRVVWLVANELVEADQILGLTFTRKAAGELGQRITSRLRRFRHGLHGATSRWTGESIGEPVISTYAAYAQSVVDEHGLRVGAEPGARLLGNAGRWQLAWDVVSRFDGHLDDDIGVPRSVTRYVLSLADELAGHLVTRDDLIGFTERIRGSVLALDEPAGFALPVRSFLQRMQDRLDLVELVERFATVKAERRVQDFADVMRLATTLSRLPSVQVAERAKFAVVLLDEYQDTSHSETVLLAELFADGRAVTAVGDPLQAIYGWRGASSSNISGYADRFRTADGQPATQFSLMTSWRNDRAILSAANIVAAPVSAPDARQLGPRPGATDGSVRITFAETTETEAEWIADRLEAEWHGRSDWTGGARTAAVLVRKRSHIPAVVTALQARGLPVEVLSLGGLLSLPEVVDVVSTLRVLTDARAGAALARLLTGDRWRVGLADLAALADRALELARAQQPLDAEGRPIGRPEPHLVDALSSPGAASRYSAEGLRRLKVFAAEISALRRRLDQPLPDLVEDIVRVSGLGLELSVRGGSGRANLDRFVDEAARFGVEPTASVASFLAYLAAAREEDRGLDTVDADVRAERIQVLTVHGAKGLEWDVVAIPGLADSSFPAAPQGESWTTARGKLPFELRGDATSLPMLVFTGATRPSEVNKALTSFAGKVNEHRLAEERRLAYVAMTRPRRALYCSGAAWSTGSSSRKPSPYLDALRSIAQVDDWHVVEPTDSNPLTARITGRLWPLDALGADRDPIRAGAELVHAAMQAQTIDHAPAAGQRWRTDVDLLLRERAERASARRIVELPSVLSASEAVAYAQDAQSFARQLRRPIPRPPSTLADRGTAFHEWLEQHYRSEALLDVDDLVAGIGQDEQSRALAELRTAFLASAWADRTPLATEVSFELPIGDTILRGRMDAVFADGDGRFTIVDWKTGAPPAGADAAAKAVQLAAYRLAWARMRSIPDRDLGQVRAAFHYVPTGLTVYPDDLLDADGLRALLGGQ